MAPRREYSSDSDDYAQETNALRETFFPPIRNLVHSLHVLDPGYWWRSDASNSRGGLEDVTDEETGEVTRVYKLGDEVLG
jgi:hypothetical protein